MLFANSVISLPKVTIVSIAGKALPLAELAGLVTVMPDWNGLCNATALQATTPV
jgi:hypothetical protein